MHNTISQQEEIADINNSNQGESSFPVLNGRKFFCGYLGHF